ncbi:hypothetical protein D3C87_1835290 [compost metagenome]
MLGSDRNTISALCATSMTDAQAWPPNAPIRAAGSGLMSVTYTGCPDLRTRLAHMGSPITPRPMKPSGVLVSLITSSLVVRLFFCCCHAAYVRRLAGDMKNWQGNFLQFRPLRIKNARFPFYQSLPGRPA